MHYLSVVIPAYNAAAYIESNLNRLVQFLPPAVPPGQTFEVVVVDDGSADSTADAAVRAGLPNVRVIRHARNRGKGAAVRTGMLEAAGAHRIFIDADLPFDLSIVSKMLDYLDRKEFDVVVGTRNPSTTDLSSRPLARRIASGIYTAIVSRVVVTGVHDTQCGVKGFRAAAAESLFGDLQTTGFAFDVEILYRAFKADMDIKRVPVHLLASEGSTVSLLRHGPAMFWTVVALPFRYHYNRLRAAGRSGHKPEHEA